MKKVALVYDRVNKWGGAERVLLTLHEMFPSAPLYTSLYDPDGADWAKIFPNVRASFLNKIPYFRNKHELLGTFMPIAFESLDFSGFDLVMSVTSEAAMGIITEPSTKYICYCLTPTRYLWSHYHDYFKGRSFKVIAKPAVSYLRTWNKIGAQRPDVMIAISKEVQNRIKKYYDRESEIIYPPVDIDKFILPDTSLPYSNEVKSDDYYLIVSRLVPYKKVDMAVNAFNKLGFPLTIIGEGSEMKKLRKMAKKNVTFIGYLSDEKLAKYYQKARALIMPQEEEFGIVAIEAQASGTPVIAFKKGGALDTVVEDTTGIFFTQQTDESLIDAVKRFARMEFKTQNLLDNAQRFSKAEFKKKMLSLINNL